MITSPTPKINQVIRFLFYIFIFLSSITGKRQSKYSGHIGKRPITFMMYHDNTGNSHSYNSYNKFDTPIKGNGNIQNGTLLFLEKKPTL
ncbi:hypothetical protein [Lacinutrix cladophorae]